MPTLFTIHSSRRRGSVDVRVCECVRALLRVAILMSTEFVFYFWSLRRKNQCCQLLYFPRPPRLKNSLRVFFLLLSDSDACVVMCDVDIMLLICYIVLFFSQHRSLLVWR